MSARVQCTYCGLPFRVRAVEPNRAYYCCSGCALAGRLPRPNAGGEFPVTPALIIALCAGFVFFNEVLFWGLGIALAHDQRAAQAALFARVSAGLGALAWVTLVAVVARAPSRRWTDALAVTATMAGLVVAVASGRQAGWVLLANGALALWLARGWGKLKFIRNRRLPI